MKKIIRDYAFLLLVSGSIIALDQWTKSLVRATLAFEQRWAPWDWLLPYARIVHWKNTGVAFGMFQHLGDVFLVLSALVSLGIIYFFPRVPRNEPYLRVALALQLGGAVGNLIDRVARGYVTDFISVGTFAVFNIADSCITIGVVVLLVGMWLRERQEKAKVRTALTDAAQDLASKQSED